LLVNQLNTSVQAPAYLIAQTVDLLLEKQKAGILLLASAYFPPLSGILQQEEKKQGEQDAEKDNDPNFHSSKSNR